MSHRQTVIELAEGVTVLAGPNNCGKSAVVSALETVCFNAGGDYMVRHGEKEARVIVETTDGHTVVWQRKGDAVSYVIDGREVGRLRGGVPEDLQRILRLPKVRPPDAKTAGDAFDVHIGRQKSPIFLLDESRGRQATFFASSSDAEKLLEMQRRHREKVGDAKRENGLVEKELGVLEGQLAALGPVEELAEAMRRVEEEHRAIVVEQERIEALERLIGDVRACVRRGEEHRARLGVLGELQPPPAMEETEVLAGVARGLVRARGESERAEKQVKVLIELLPPPVLAEWGPLVDLVGRWEENRERTQQHVQQLAGIDREVAETRRRVEEWVEAHPECPVCGGVIDPAKVLAGGHGHE